MLVATKKYKFYIIKTEFYRFIIELGKLSIELFTRLTKKNKLWKWQKE